jgi:hypothetical protein
MGKGWPHRKTKNDHEASGSRSGKKPRVEQYIHIEFMRRLWEENQQVPWPDASLPSTTTMTRELAIDDVDYFDRELAIDDNNDEGVYDDGDVDEDAEDDDASETEYGYLQGGDNGHDDGDLAWDPETQPPDISEEEAIANAMSRG